MYGIRTAIVADGSAVGRQLTELLLRQHCAVVLVAADEEAAWEAVQRAEGPTVLIADVALPPSGGIALFERCAARGGERPAFVATAVHHDVDEETRVTMLGAIGYLTKPISYRDIAHLLRGRQVEFSRSAPRARAHPLTRAEACDQGKAPQLWWDVTDLSVSGAFLVTRAPLPVGTTLELLVHLTGEAINVTAQIVRVQEPSWAHVGGVGVAFRGIDPAAFEKLERFVRSALQQTR